MRADGTAAPPPPYRPSDASRSTPTPVNGILNAPCPPHPHPRCALRPALHASKEAVDFVSGGVKASRHGRRSLRDATLREATYYCGSTYANPPPCSTDGAPWLTAVVSHNRNVLRFGPTPIQRKWMSGTMAYGLFRQHTARVRVHPYEEPLNHRGDWDRCTTRMGTRQAGMLLGHGWITKQDAAAGDTHPQKPLANVAQMYCPANVDILNFMASCQRPSNSLDLDETWGATAIDVDNGRDRDMEMAVAIEETKVEMHRTYILKDLEHSQEPVEVLEILCQSVREINQLAKAISSRNNFGTRVYLPNVRNALLVKHLVNDFYTVLYPGAVSRCMHGYAIGWRGLVGATAAAGGRVRGTWGASQKNDWSRAQKWASPAGPRRARAGEISGTSRGSEQQGGTLNSGTAVPGAGSACIPHDVGGEKPRPKYNRKRKWIPTDATSDSSFEKERKRFGAQRATRGVAATENDSIVKVETGQWVQEARASGMV
ncbi:hypothetical protein B0H14DRAFT_2585603 [Mycena olivaceomarginata]|nr:hypothetical protein B0H14DRAFT_2585603 [Mycena olivaceomarginata]